MFKLVRFLTVFAAVFSCTICAAGDSASARISNLGLGISYLRPLSENTDLRFDFNGYDFDRLGIENDVIYHVDHELRTLGAVLEWRPWSNRLHLSAGLFFNNNQIRMQADDNDSYDIGANTYTPAEIGQLNASIDFSEIAPFVGIGYDTSLNNDKHWRLSTEIGFLFQGKTNIAFRATGTAAGTPALQNDLALESQNLSRDLERFERYFVIGVGIMRLFP